MKRKPPEPISIEKARRLADLWRVIPFSRRALGSSTAIVLADLLWPETKMTAADLGAVEERGKIVWPVDPANERHCFDCRTRSM